VAEAVMGNASVIGNVLVALAILPTGGCTTVSGVNSGAVEVKVPTPFAAPVAEAEPVPDVTGGPEGKS
jgi:hypothetical protein